jgi:hypothetical protein
MALLIALVAQDAGAASGPDWSALVGAACHIAPERLVVQHWEDSDYDVLLVQGSAPLSDVQMRCYAEQLIANGAPLAAFADDRLTQRYTAIVRADWAATQRKERMDARAYLRQHGFLNRPPRFDRRHERLSDYAVRLERLCHARPHSALEVVDGMIQLTQDSLNGPIDDFEPKYCAIEAAIAWDYSPHQRGLELPPPREVLLPVRQIVEPAITP